jgi:transcriptional regulator GlxA family with amidase domain
MTRRIVGVAYRDLVLLDLVGPCEVFAMANHIARKLHTDAPDPYTVEIVSATRALCVKASSGLALLADGGLDGLHGEIT